ncbi:MAG: radical SAM protein [Chitinispirillaceae bacterium]|nr:radical SAM protein [Chitinispirillaceae bacterium]
MSLYSDNFRIFGPVPSRRLGHSLGIDLVPFKTCTYDCLYCQLGRTTVKTLERKVYVPPEEIVQQLAEKLKQPQPVDYITLSGSGEPTLYLKTAELIGRIKVMTDIPVAVLTNGSLLWDKTVREGLMEADLVIPSLDAGNDPLFQLVNRPCPGIIFDKMVAGIQQFKQEFKGALWLEIFLLDGITATQAAVEEIAFHALHISPDKVQLNTVSRPPCEKNARAVPRARMLRLAEMFDAPAEVIADYENIHGESGFAASREEVFDLISRRPCTLEDVAGGLSIHRNEAIKHLEQLVHEERIVAVAQGERNYYRRIAGAAERGSG